MSNRTKLILAGVGLLLIVVILVTVYSLSGTQNPTPTPGGSSTTLPAASSTTSQPGTGTVTVGTGGTTLPTMTVAARDGSAPITTLDFLNDGTTVPDPSNKGNYYLTGLTDASGYAISYLASKQFFTIALDREPIGEMRTNAEYYLLNTLGISKSDLCNINYYIGTSVDVNDQYAGKNLGFSFCPGEIPLPQ